MNEYAQPKIMVHYNVNGRFEWQNEHSEAVPTKGEYVLYGGKAYVVVEVWNIFDKHGAHTHGMNVFLEPVNIMETALGKSDPAYYGG